MERVGFWNVAGKTRLLITARARLFGLYWLALLAVPLAQGFLFGTQEEGSAGAAVLGVASFFLSTALTLSLYHFVVASCRNETSFFPQRPVRTYLQYLLASLGLAVICMLFAALAGIPFFGVLASGMADKGTPAGLGVLLLLAAGLLMGLGGLIPLLRLGFVLIALAIGDRYDYGRAWSMTRGYTLKMLGALSLGMLPPFALGIVWALADESSTNSVPFQFLDVVLTCSCIMFMSVFWAVLYQEISLREPKPEEGGQGGGSSPGTPSSQD